MTEPSNASDSNDEYESSSVTVPKTSPCDPIQLKNALIKLTDFDLQDEQIGALPALPKMSLIEQHDSHRISTEEGYRDAYGFKLYVGEKKWSIDGEKRRDPAFVYLFESVSNKKNAPFKIQICNGDIEEGHWPPIDAMYFGEVSDLAFSFNGQVTSERRIAVAKFYFKLGFEAGLYTEDPGFQVTDTWKKHLHAACDDLVDLKNRTKAVKDLRRQTRASSALTRPSATRSESTQPLIHRTHTTITEQERETMTGSGNKERRFLQSSRDGLTPPTQDPRRTRTQHYTVPDDRRSRPLSESTFGGHQVTHEPVFPGYREARPHRDYPPAAVQPYMQDSRASLFTQPSLTGHFNDGVRLQKPSRSESVSKPPGLVPNMVEPRQGTSLGPMAGRSTEKAPEPRGEFSSTSTSIRFTTIEKEYATLYRQRHQIFERMEEIKSSLTAARYAALIAKLDPQELATLKPWSDGTEN